MTKQDLKDEFESERAKLSVQIDQLTAERNQLKHQLGNIRKILRLRDAEIDEYLQTIIDSIPKSYEP